jgi:hypothetical protein
MANTVAEIAGFITEKILTGGRRTTAEFVRYVLNAMKDSYLNLKDGGLFVEKLTGYSSALTPTDPKHFVTKAFAESMAGAVFTQEITCDGSTTLYTINHNLNTRNIVASICLGQSDFQELVIPPKRTSVNAIQYDLGGYDITVGTKYLITVRK